MMMGQSGADYSQQYLTFTVGGNYNCRFKYTVNGLVATTNMQYSLDDGKTWVALASGTDTPEVSIGSSIMWKADGWTASNSNYISFSKGSGTSEGIIVSGNIMSLLYGDNFVGQTAISNNYQFYYLFNGYATVSDASNLILPATTLTQYCYSGMFRNCTSLTTAPKLPAEALVGGCYSSMFYGCSSLHYIKCLATNISASGCLSNWVNGVAATGTFVKVASMSSWPSGANGIPSGWTVQNA